MKVLFLEWNGYGNKDIIDSYRQLQHEVVIFPYKSQDCRSNPEYEEQLTQQIRLNSPDYVFSFNHYPLVAQVCNREGLPYVSWIYDSPYVSLYSYTTIFPCNYIFIFDKEFCYEFQKNGIETVHYLPMAANTNRLDAMNNYIGFRQSPYLNQTDIAFVGSLYTEEVRSGFFDRLKNVTPYTRGYLDGIMAAQKNVFGYNFIQELLTPDIIKDFENSCPIETNYDGVESKEYIYAQYFINRQITALERTEIVRFISNYFPMDLYTSAKGFSCPNVFLHEPIDYYNIAPYVYKNTKINLNISLRSIKSGMPLRAFDIMGAGGFLLSNFQADFLDYFVPGEDFAFYDSQKDLVEKIDYYLRNDKERAEVAASAHKKIQQHHTFVHRILEMESYLP